MENKLEEYIIIIVSLSSLSLSLFIGASSYQLCQYNMLLKSRLNLKYAIYNVYINNINECNQSNNHVDYFQALETLIVLVTNKVYESNIA